MMKIRSLAAIAVIAVAAMSVSACSHNDAVTFNAVKTLENSPPNLKVALKLNKFDAKNDAGGDGTITIEKPADSATVAQEGTFPITWSWQGADGTFAVRVPDLKDAFTMAPSPMAMADLVSNGRDAKVFWCSDCEQNRGGNGSFMPGIFVKKDD